MKRALSVLAVAGVLVAFVLAWPILTAPPLTSSSPFEYGRFTGDDRDLFQGGGSGIWDGDDGDSRR